MSSPAVDRRLPSWILILTLGLTAVIAGPWWFAGQEDSLRRELLDKLSAANVGSGRLLLTPASRFDPETYKKSRIQAELILLSEKDSPRRQRLEALVAAGAGNLELSADILRELNEEYPDNVQTLNDLGVVYMALGEQHVSNYLRAARLFERARRLAIHPAVPAFNSVLAYRRLGLDEVADQAFHEYRRLEGSPYWLSKLRTGEPAYVHLTELKGALDAKDSNSAMALLRSNITTFRKIALDETLAPRDPLDLAAFDFILSASPELNSDMTLSALLAPLHSPSRPQAIDVRRLVQNGIEAYLRGRFEESSHFYDLAEAGAESLASAVDQLWIQLNRADVDLRLGKIDAARSRLDHVIAQSRQRNFKWLLGKALAAKGANVNLVGNYEQVLQVLNEAVSILTSTSAPQDAARALNYLASMYSVAGDLETALNFSYQALDVTPATEPLRRSQLYWIIGMQLYRLGFGDYADSLHKASLSEAKKAGNKALAASVLPYLAMTQVARRNYAAAEDYLSEARSMIHDLESGNERTIGDLNLNLLCAHIKTITRDFVEAEKCLSENIAILGALQDPAPYYLTRTLLQAAETHSLQERFESTRSNFAEAARVLEANDVYMGADSLRMSFENERRDLYEKAIAFEYTHDGRNAAWRYTQNYRSKLFLEFLKQMNIGIEGVRQEAIEQGNVQRLIPPDVQVVEYVLLPDQLLIWLGSSDRFVSVAVPVSRSEIEGRVSDFTEDIQEQRDVRKQAAQLHRLLIEPIEAHLDPNRALAIIPDQALHRLNFPALYSAAKKSYLIQRYTILENPSLTSLLSGNPGAPARGKAVAFGAQTDDTNASVELKGLRQYYTGIETLDGAAALKPAFLSAMPGASVFHYAGHSQDASDPLRSAILLDGNKEGPNSVTAVDITRVRMPPNSVVVLASCDSSVGNSRDGVGMRGLTSAFLISGAGSVVGSLWLVEASHTSRLVLSFHKHFAQDKLPVAAALRKAQLELIDEGKHPYYWSGFVVTGNLSALR